jgi:hypothetical protein
MNTPIPPAKSGVAGAVNSTLSINKPVQAAADDAKARAAKRAAQLLEHDEFDGDEEDAFYIDPKEVPEGWCYEWKTLTVLGQPDPSYQVSLAHKGWEAVPRSRHPSWMPDNWKGETIERKGMLLMERPQEITDRVRAAEARKAQLQVRGKEAQLGAAPAGQFERDNKGNPLVNVKRSYEHIAVPEK